MHPPTPLHPDDLRLSAAICREALAPALASDVEPWAALRWACGRTSPLGRARLGPDWWVHCAPLAEWDGTIKTRTSPPAWT
ncbi:MAG TPA: hypothetical protein VFQ80_06785 [Thermomicrobiales bacterium]|nr:hypothetical protein [Thermomicrobiales bacterium]